MIRPKITKWYHEDAVTKFVAEAIEDATMDAERDFSLHLKRTYVTGMVDLKVPPHGLYNEPELMYEQRVAFARWAAHIERLTSGQPAKIVSLNRWRK